ncbi:hypothetical protein D3C87_372710 [compost metagenome]
MLNPQIKSNNKIKSKSLDESPGWKPIAIAIVNNKTDDINKILSFIKYKNWLKSL